MSFIENAKTYTGRDLETIFFRPMLSGQSALDLGVRILYNMPAPTTVQLWERSGDILQQYTAAGWTGGDPARKLQKTIDMSKVKAELGYSAADYFSMIYELITNRADVNMDDLTGTELEQAETELFKQRHRRKPPRDDVDRRQGGGRGHGVRHVQRIHQTHLRTARREQDHGSEDLRRGRPRRGRSGRRYLRRRMDRSRRRADRPETRRTAGLLRHLGSLPPLREVSRLVRQHRGGLHRPDRRPAGTHLPRHSGRRPPPVVLPARYDLRPVVLPADRPAQSGAGGQHGRFPRQRSPHVVQPRPDGKPTACRLHGRVRSARRETVSYAYKE